MRMKNSFFVTAIALLMCSTILFASPGHGKKEKKPKKGVELVEVNMTMVNYSPVEMIVTPSGQGGGGPNLYIYSADFSSFNPIAEEALIGAVADPNRYGNKKWTTTYTVTFDSMEDVRSPGEEVELGSFTLQYITDSKGIPRIQIYQDDLDNQIISIDGSYYEVLTTVYPQNIMVMIIPFRNP